MQKETSISEFFTNNSVHYPIVRLLRGLRGHMDYVISMYADVENGYVKLKMPTRYHFRFCDELVKQFVYVGLSFDELIIEPKYKNTNRTAEASNVELHISVKSDNNENRLVIKYKH